jgi:hypothetical protein
LCRCPPLLTSNPHIIPVCHIRNGGKSPSPSISSSPSLSTAL